MAQFDVHRNTGRLKESIPFVVIVQSALFDGYRRRVVVPLVKVAAAGPPVFAVFNPIFKIRNTAVMLHPLDIVSLPVKELGVKVGSLREQSGQITAALDELLNRAWA